MSAAGARRGVAWLRPSYRGSTCTRASRVFGSCRRRRRELVADGLHHIGKQRPEGTRGLFPAFSLSRELSREFSREKTREFVFRGETRINTGELETTRELAGK